MNFGMSEMIFIFLAALILVGPKKLPEIMRQVGKFMNEFKRASNEFKWQIESEIHNLERETELAKQTILPPVALPPQGTVASGGLLEARPVEPAGPASDSPTDSDHSIDHSPASASAKSVDA